MDSPERPAFDVDPELVGHDQELARTVDALRLSGAERAVLATPPEDTLPGPREAASPFSSSDVGVRKPSGFFTQALPLFGQDGRPFPWRSYAIAGVLTVVFSTAVAWGTVYWLKPSAFSRASTRAPGPEAAPRAVVQVAPPVPVPVASGASPTLGSSGVTTSMDHSPIRRASAPSKRPYGLSLSAASAPTAASPTAEMPEPPSPSAPKKAWFQ